MRLALFQQVQIIKKWFPYWRGPGFLLCQVHEWDVLRNMKAEQGLIIASIKSLLTQKAASRRWKRSSRADLTHLLMGGNALIFIPILMNTPHGKCLTPKSSGRPSGKCILWNVCFIRCSFSTSVDIDGFRLRCNHVHYIHTLKWVATAAVPPAKSNIFLFCCGHDQPWQAAFASLGV